jgi:gamma-glutamylcyclotransferase (GGCT)/AIG2-like uncharacterized protein YtfP
MRVFVYGTLLDPALLARLTGRTPIMRPASLPGWRRVRLRDAPYPTLVRGRHTVDGALIEVDRPALRRLSAYEGPRYRLVPVAPRVAGGSSQPALAWIARGATNVDWP